MRGHIRKRGKRSWSIVIDIGRDANGRRRQKWHPVAGTKRDAEKELTRSKWKQKGSKQVTDPIIAHGMDQEVDPALRFEACRGRLHH